MEVILAGTSIGNRNGKHIFEDFLIKPKITCIAWQRRTENELTSKFTNVSLYYRRGGNAGDICSIVVA